MHNDLEGAAGSMKLFMGGEEVVCSIILFYSRDEALLKHGIKEQQHMFSIMYHSHSHSQ